MDFQVPNTLAEQIANYLAERIMTGQIRPGERIQEATLATQLKVARLALEGERRRDHTQGGKQQSSLN